MTAQLGKPYRDKISGCSGYAVGRRLQDGQGVVDKDGVPHVLLLLAPRHTTSWINEERLEPFPV